MKYVIIITIIFSFFAVNARSEQYFSTKICQTGEYNCLQARPDDTWASLFPEPNLRDLIQRFNRMNTPLKPWMYVAIPENFKTIDLASLAPFPYSITPPGHKLIVVDLSILAWGAYKAEGTLVRWGPASGGRNWCYDIKSPGKTVVGEFNIYDIRGKNCVSSQFPIKKGGAAMPYSMFFQRGYALHGSDEVPGYNASHGCIRLFQQDAKWLNTEFVRMPCQVTVLVLPYEE